jgi:uncharacterized alkaline shock family protein YloU
LIQQEVQEMTDKEYAQEMGTVRIADDVVAIIAGLAATEVEGVAGMSGGFAGGIAEILGRRNLSKGVKVEVSDTEAFIELFIIVKYGARIPDVAWNIQENVKKAVENMTGLATNKVNVHIQGVEFGSRASEEEEG